MADRINVSVIGCGLFASFMHLPNIAANDKFKLHSACDLEQEKARAQAEKYDMAYFTADYKKVLQDPDVDLVVITTRHDGHARLAIESAKAGKHILCEKPMALNIEDCRAVMRAVKENGVKYTVGYNRGLAPCISYARKIVKEKNQPAVVYHRMSNFIKDHWLMEGEIGGGRVVGEGCHVLDLLCVITGSEPVRVYAEGGVFSGDDPEAVPDTQVVTIGFDDGSIASMVLSSVGNIFAPKESTEIFCGQTTIFISDFVETKIRDSDATLHTITAPEQDKGQTIEIDLLADAIINDTEPPNGPENACRAALMSYKVLEAIKTGKVQHLKKSEYAL